MSLQPGTVAFAGAIVRARRFYLDAGRARRSSLAVVAGGWEFCAADYRIARSDFPYLSVELVTSGRGEVTLSGRRHPLAPGNVFSYGPGVSQVIVSDGRDRLEKYFVDFEGAEAAQALERSGLRPGSCSAVSNLSRVAAIFEELVTLGTLPHRDSAEGAAHALGLLMIALRQERAEVRDLGSARATFDRCQARLREDFLKLRSVREFARSCHIDAAYLCRLYQRFAGQSPHRCLARLQMDWVAGRLLEPNTQVRSVADDLGVDPFQLSRSFRRVFGLSPTQFVRQRSGG